MHPRPFRRADGALAESHVVLAVPDKSLAFLSMDDLALNLSYVQDEIAAAIEADDAASAAAWFEEQMTYLAELQLRIRFIRPLFH